MDLFSLIKSTLKNHLFQIAFSLWLYCLNFLNVHLSCLHFLSYCLLALSERCLWKKYVIIIIKLCEILILRKFPYYFDSLGPTATNCLYFPVFVTVQPHWFLGLLHHSFSWSRWRPVLQRFGPLSRIHKRNMNKTVKKYTAYVWVVSKVDSAKSIFCIT